MQNNTFFGHSQPSCTIVLDNISSTNDYLKDLLSNFKPQQPFTAIMAKEQTSGRGQRGSNWLAKANENFTVSFLNSPQNLPISEQFIITITTSLAIYDTLRDHLNDDVYIKWPNDIMVNNKKIAGVLIENKISSTSIKHSIIGIGINVYSTDFPIEIKHKTTSIVLENFEFQMTIIDLLRAVKRKLIHYEKMRLEGHISTLWQLYIERLFRKDVTAKYLIDNHVIEGVITGVHSDGRLILNIDGTENKYDLKDISYQI